MKSIILAAGVSTRLRPLTQFTPKCLLSVGRKPLLQRTLENLFAAGISDVDIVTGFAAEKIGAFVRSTFPGRRIRFTTNIYYARTNNAYSLLLARRSLLNGNGSISHGFLLLDSDILFDGTLLPVLLDHPAENRVAVRVAGPHDAEEVGVRVAEGNRIVQIGKEVLVEQTDGESIGIEYLSASAAARLFEVLEHRVRAGAGRTEYYEAAFQQMIDEGIDLTAVDVSGHPVLEIDTVRDLTNAERLAETLPG
jgi:choline kinase